METAKCHSWEDLTGAGYVVKVAQHGEYSMKMIGMGETGMTMMGGVDRWCCQKICLNQRSLFLNLHIVHFNIFMEFNWYVPDKVKYNLEIQPKASI